MSESSIKAYREDQEITKRNFDWKDSYQKSHFFEKKFGFGIVASKSCSVAMDHGYLKLFQEVFGKV